ncbi:hypothetical protein XENORESO_009976, partial [Xenotaenia resolanae]
LYGQFLQLSSAELNRRAQGGIKKTTNDSGETYGLILPPASFRRLLADEQRRKPGLSHLVSSSPVFQSLFPIGSYSQMTEISMG